MFQKLTVYRIAAGLPGNADALAHYLEHSEFFATTATQESAIGFAPPRAQHGAFVEAIAGHWIARLVIELRRVPTSAIQKRVAEVVAKIEQDQGRKPGKKERREIKEDALLALLPQAFPKQVAVPIWIDPRAGLLMIGSTSRGQIDDAITALVRAVPDLQVVNLVTQVSPAALMRSWLLDSDDLSDDERLGFSLGRECELRADDSSKAVVRYKNQDLDRADVREHIEQGKSPTSLALDYKGRVSFTLTDGMQLKGIDLLDVVFDRIVAGTPLDDTFDGDVAIATGELSQLVADLIAALGGEMQVPQEGGAA